MKHGGAKTILAAQLARFGDFLQSTPLLAALKDKHPGARLTVLVDAGQADLARTNPDIEEVWSVDLNKLRALARSRSNLSDILHRTQSELSFLSGRSFDLVINLNTSRTAALLCALIPGEKRLGPALAADRSSIETAPWTGFIMNLMKHRPMIRFNLVDLLTCYAGLEKRPSDALIYRVGLQARARARELIGPRPDGPLIGFQMGSKHLSRQWPPENFALLARDLISEHGAGIVLLGAETEIPLGRTMKEELARIHPFPHQVIDLMGRTTIEDLGGVLAGLDLLATTDTGTMHLAAAVKTPILALFMGPALCHETGPYGSGHLIFQATTECSPCSEGRSTCRDFWCRRLITPEMVLKAASFMLDPGAGSRPEHIKSSSRVRLLISRLDDFGVVYQPLVPWPAGRTDILALACREAGRFYLRSGYRPDEKILESELAGYLAPVDSGPRRLANTLSELENKLNNGRAVQWPGDPDLSFLPGLLTDLARRESPEIAGKFMRDLARTANYAVEGIMAGPRPKLRPGPDDPVQGAEW